jgi:hypothetical protein
VETQIEATIDEEVRPLTTYEERKVAGVCTRCGAAPAADDSLLCEVHRDSQRSAAAGWAARERERRRAAGECLWCPSSARTNVAPGESSCLACRVKRHRVPKPGAQLRAAATFVRRRRGRDGQESNAERNRRDAERAAECLEALRGGLALIETAALPPPQQLALVGAVCHEGERTTGHVAAVLERLRHPQNHERQGREGAQGK